MEDLMPALDIKIKAKETFNKVVNKLMDTDGF